jgi:hypothetical protein
MRGADGGLPGAALPPAHLSSSAQAASSAPPPAATPASFGPPRTSWASTRATASGAPAAAAASHPAALFCVRFMRTASRARRQSCRQVWRRDRVEEPCGALLAPLPLQADACQQLAGCRRCTLSVAAAAAGLLPEERA